MKTGSAILAVSAVLAGAAPGRAETFTPPAGCEVLVTVQLRQCTVANHYRCADDAPGARWISYADGSGIYFTSLIDAETRWMESYAHETGEVDLLDEAGSADHASFSALLTTGRDDYDFVTANNFGEVRRYRGFDRLTGEKVTIDGVPLERCEFDLSAFDGAGNFVSRRRGMQYVNREMRVFFGDTETFDNAQGDSVTTAQPPASFAFPGEDGFAAAEPIFDCDMLMTALPRIGGRS